MPKTAKVQPIQEPQPGPVLAEEVIPPPEKEEEEIPQLDQVITDRKQRLEMIRLIQSDLEWKVKESEAKKARKPLSSAMKKILGKWEIRKALWNGYSINYFDSSRTSIDKDDLVNALSSLLQPTQIKNVLKACIKESTFYTLKITPPGREDDNGEQ